MKILKDIEEAEEKIFKQIIKSNKNQSRILILLEDEILQLASKQKYTLCQQAEIISQAIGKKISLNAYKKVYYSKIKPKLDRIKFEEKTTQESKMIKSNADTKVEDKVEDHRIDNVNAQEKIDNQQKKKRDNRISKEELLKKPIFQGFDLDGKF